MARKGKAKEQNTFHVGLEWPVAFPLGEKEYYWYTASGRKQPYVSFIPSIWISKALNENVEILLDVAPFSQITGKHNTFTTTGTINASDSMATGQTTTMLQLVKVQSCHLALSMGYCFSDQWQIRLGIGGSRIYKALFKEETYNDQTGDLQSSELISVRSGDSRMSKMHLWQMDANASIAYKWNWIEAGVELRVPLTKLSYSLFIQPFAANLYFRFRLK